MSSTQQSDSSERSVRTALAQLGIDKDDPRCSECGAECTHVVRHNALHGPPMRVVCETCIPKYTSRITLIPREYVKLQYINARGKLHVYDERGEEPI